MGQAGGHAECRTPHGVVLRGIAPVVFLDGRTVKPHHSLPVLADELQQGGIGLRAEARRLLVVAVSALEHHQDHVVFIDDAGPQAPRILHHADPEKSGVLQD